MNTTRPYTRKEYQAVLKRIKARQPQLVRYKLSEGYELLELEWFRIMQEGDVSVQNTYNQDGTRKLIFYCSTLYFQLNVADDYYPACTLNGGCVPMDAIYLPLANKI